MVAANVKIIEELKYFLDTISTEEAIRELVCGQSTDFSRNRKLPLKRLVGLIINQPKRSLSVEIEAFFDHLNQGSKACTKGAFSLQRTKLRPLFFKVWNKWLADSFYHHYGSHCKRWRGFLIQAVDGSSVYLFDKPEVIEHFGTQYNQYKETPLARVMQVHDLLNDFTQWGDIHPITQSEQSIISRRVSQLPADSITLFDRAYPGYALMYLMMHQETCRHFVMRCKTTFSKEVKHFLGSRKRSKVILLTPEPQAIATLFAHGYMVTKQTQLKVRMVRITLPDGEPEVLLTSLCDQRFYTIQDIYYLYGLRWGIETAYSKQKNQQQMEQFSGHRVVCIEQDYAAGLFVANLQSLIEKQCEAYVHRISSFRKHSYRINRNVSWSALKHTIVKLFLEHDTMLTLMKLQQAFERNTEPLRPGRRYKRMVRARSKGKYQTFTNYKRAI